MLQNAPQETQKVAHTSRHRHTRESIVVLFDQIFVMHESLLFGTCIVTAIAWQAISLLKSYSEARRIGLPIVLSPTRTLNPLWIILCKITPIVSLLQYLPFNLGRWARVSYMGWQFDDKDATHQELGTAFVLCTPGLNEVHLADPSAAHMVLTRRKEFIKPSVMYGQYTGQSLFRGQTFGGTNDAFLFNITNTWSTEPLNVFGRNLDAVSTDQHLACRFIINQSCRSRAISGNVIVD